MSVLKPRNRLVYFRVSEDEFLQLSALCQSMGARSLSALARTAMQRMMTAPRDETQVVDKLKVFDDLASRLIENLRYINELLVANGRGGLANESDGPVTKSSLEQTTNV